MKKEEYISFLNQISNYDNFDSYGSINSDSILKAEKLLGIKMTGYYLYFIEKYGTISVLGEEIYGVTNDDFLNSGIPNGIWLTLQERQNMELPENLLIIAEDYYGGYVCLDYNDKDCDNEPNVVIYNSGNIGAFIPKKEHLTFFEFLKIILQK